MLLAVEENNEKFWPEPETNYTRYYEGSHGGNTSVYLTPGIVLGRFKIHNRFAFAIGREYEIALTSFHPTNHVAIASVRFPWGSWWCKCHIGF
jgi:hypothetical protein